MTQTPYRPLLYMMIALGIILVATASRFHMLGTQSLWYDEGVAYTHSLRTLPELVPVLQRNVHVPAYFALLGLWEDVAGSSEFALRLISAFFSILSVAWAYALGKRLYHPIAGLVAAGLVALNTFSIYYGQEARMYAMLTSIAGASMWVFIGFLRAPNWQHGLALGLINALGIYTHVVYALVMLSQGVLAVVWLGGLLYPRRATHHIRRAGSTFTAYSLANILTIALFAPWLAVALSQVFSQPNISDPVPLDLVLRVLQGWFAFGNTFEFSMGNMGFVMYFLLLFGLISSHAPTQQPHSTWRMLLPIVWVIVSVILYLYLELTTRYLRFLLPTQLAFALWIGRGVWVLWSRQTRGNHVLLRHMPRLAAFVATCALLITLANGLNPLYTHPDFQRDDIRGLSQAITNNIQDGDAVLVSAAGVAEVLRYYYDADNPVYGLPTSPDDAETAQAIRDIIATHNKIYAVFYGTDEQDPNGIVEATLNNNAYEISEQWFDDMRFAQYVAPATFEDIQAVDVRFGNTITLASVALNTQVIQAGDALQVQLVWQADTTPTVRYKVFLQLLNRDGVLVAQRDSEPAGGLSLTTTWEADTPIIDNHALAIPSDLTDGNYTLILGLYDINDPSARATVNGDSFYNLANITIESGLK